MKVLSSVFVKELRDALRDRRALLVAILVPLAAGPVTLGVISWFLSGVEERVAKREVVLDYPERAPSLTNFLARAGAHVTAAPEDYLDRLRTGKLQNAVIRVPADFEARLAAAQPATVEAVFDGSQDRSRPVVSTVLQLIEGYNREAAMQRLLARGLDPGITRALKVEQINLAPAQSRGAMLLFIVPWITLLVSVVSAVAVAIDLTAGERERGSLEPLLGNPVAAWVIVLGKWGVVLTYAAGIMLLTMAGFLVSMRLVSSEGLAALMQLDWLETAAFVALLVPFSGLMAAANMLVASFARSFREAQTAVSYLSMTVTFAAVVPVLLTDRDSGWQSWVPAVAQMGALLKTLRGDPLGPADFLVPAFVCAAGVAGCLAALARVLRSEAVVFSRS